MKHSEYIFDQTQEQRELERLRMIETAFDPHTKTRLRATGLRKGWQCLEIGAGAGSIMDWLGDQVGSDGRIVAVDLNPRYLERRNINNIEVFKGDICDVDLGDI